MGRGAEQPLREQDLASTWLAQFESWHRQVHAAGDIAEPDAMVLATADANGRPSARTVLLKGLDTRGFQFFTGRDSRKGRDLAANPSAALVFGWYAMRRQVLVSGAVEELPAERADEYFATRAYGSRISALASRQSSVIAGRAELEAARTELEQQHPPGGAVPRPERWIGYRVVPDSVEFWQGRPDRLHDRLRFRRERDDEWVVERLSP
jgi:pyridoxamine 5'-phosphate oxidase